MSSLKTRVAEPKGECPWPRKVRVICGATQKVIQSPATPTARRSLPRASRLRTIGVDESSAGVAGLYSDFLDGWLVDEEDPMPDRRGLEVVRRPLLMSSVEAAADMAGAALDLGLRLRAERAPA